VLHYPDFSFVALGSWHAMRMRHVFIYGQSPVQYFSTLSHKRKYFRRKFIDHEMCVLIFCATFV
jgi:hypothetical protein